MTLNVIILVLVIFYNYSYDKSNGISSIIFQTKEKVKNQCENEWINFDGKVFFRKNFLINHFLFNHKQLDMMVDMT